MDVGVRELKQHLSEYLDRAARGETIRVTERGRPKAVLGPVPGRVRLDVGIAERWIRAGQNSPPLPVRAARGRRTVAESMREDRGE